MINSIVEGILLPLVAGFGIIGNLASICVLRDNRLEMKATFRCVEIILYSDSLDSKYFQGNLNNVGII